MERQPDQPDKSRHGDGAERPKLTPKQHAAIDELLRGRTDARAARAAGVSRQTVNIWRNHHAAFRAELDRRRRLESSKVWVSTREMAERLGVTTQTVYVWADAGVLPTIRFGRTRRFNLKDMYLMAVLAGMM
jgi:excisionase family DNA binding protein